MYFGVENGSFHCTNSLISIQEFHLKKIFEAVVVYLLSLHDNLFQWKVSVCVMMGWIYMVMCIVSHGSQFGLLWLPQRNISYNWWNSLFFQWTWVWSGYWLRFQLPCWPSSLQLLWLLCWRGQCQTQPPFRGVLPDNSFHCEDWPGSWG